VPQDRPHAPVPTRTLRSWCARWRPGAVAGAQCVVVERTDCGDQERGEDFEAGWDAGVTVISDDLVAIADRTYEQRGRGAPALQLLAHLRQREQLATGGGG